MIVVFKIEGIFQGETFKATSFNEARKVAARLLQAYSSEYAGEFVRILKVEKPNLATSQFDKVVREWRVEK